MNEIQCDFLKWEFQCPKYWESLELTNNQNLRFCPECKQDVYRVRSEAEARRRAQEGKCIAIIEEGVEDRIGLMIEPYFLEEPVKEIEKIERKIQQLNGRMRRNGESPRILERIKNLHLILVETLDGMLKKYELISDNESYKNQIKSIVTILYEIKSQYFSGVKHACDQPFCSTCGGYFRVIDERLPEEVKERIVFLLPKLEKDDYTYFGNWQEYIEIAFRQEFQEMIINQKTDLNDLRQLDEFIFNNRDQVRRANEAFKEYYYQALEMAKKRVLETKDESLLESLVIILGDSLDNNREILNLAREKAKQHAGISRALYNKARHIKD